MTQESTDVPFAAQIKKIALIKNTPYMQALEFYFAVKNKVGQDISPQYVIDALERLSSSEYDVNHVTILIIGQSSSTKKITKQLQNNHILNPEDHVDTYKLAIERNKTEIVLSDKTTILGAQNKAVHLANKISQVIEIYRKDGEIWTWVDRVYPSVYSE